MKNIHILPTDKPSRLYLENEVFKLSEYDYPNVDYAQNQNIYITSDEEIKEGDWILNETHNIEKAISYYNYKSLSSDCKKIILTTDQGLIKDGVQAIDDEFLEWFVKNPSCEYVRIGKGYFKNDYEQSLKIIIPKEEPKQETLEEAIKKEYKFGISSHSFPNPVNICGQQERMYSEEEVENILIEYVKTNPTKPYRVVNWFRQIKKK